MKICVIYNFAQLYREPVFRAIDSRWECEWWFGKNTTDIKPMAADALKETHLVDNVKVLGPLYRQSETGHLIRQKDFTHFILLGEPMNLSTWWLLLQRRLFCRSKKVYLWTHGWYGREGFAKKWLKRIFFGMADHVFTYGHYAKSVAIAQGFRADKITPIHNSLNHSFQVELRNNLRHSQTYKDHFGNDNPTLIFIGRLTAVKRLDQLLEALALLNRRGKPFNLALIGTGEKHSELKQRVKSLNLESQVWFYGPCYDDKINAQLIYDADLCVAPGNVGLTAMHTMVFGTPVLTHDDFQWQMPEFEAILSGVTGAFFKRNDVVSLVDAIEQWVASHPDRDAVRQACFAEIDTNWTPEYQIKVLNTVIGK